MELTKQIQTYIDTHRQEAYDLLLELAQIPAPSNHEEKRAVFCKAWLEKQGAKGGPQRPLVTGRLAFASTCHAQGVL